LLRVHGTTMIEDFKREEEALSEVAPVDEEIMEKQEQKDDKELSTNLEASEVRSHLLLDESKSSVAIPAIQGVKHQEAMVQAIANTALSKLPVLNVCPNNRGKRLKPDDVCPVNETPLRKEDADTMTVEEAIAKAGVVSEDVLPAVKINASELNVKVEGEDKSEALSVDSILPPPLSPSAAMEINLGDDRVAATATESEQVIAEPHPEQGMAQDSVFKTITKRLTALEHNVTISQRYLEEQGYMLKSVFGSFEEESKRLREQLSVLEEQFEEKVKKLQDMDIRQRWLMRQVHLLTEEFLFEKRLNLFQLLVLGALISVLAYRQVLGKMELPEGWQRLKGYLAAT